MDEEAEGKGEGAGGKEAELEGYLEKAQTPLRKSLTLSTSLETPHIPTLVLLGETLINSGNLHDSESDSESDSDDKEEDGDENEDSNPAITYYKEAFELFKKAQEADPESLPEQFVEFVEEWEKDL
ncbi:hypothetical protein HK097_006254 [Rhizophlyctis rosea]|uniref:Uncharacterized protein n=1 Tax=Rhizophlyctis rosea TaxID=64517 RepID=A0AAD5WWJ1_9FUNG|nr:hypothetical protein HK097_006254 [Rhizophlyctis rosea]